MTDNTPVRLLPQHPMGSTAPDAIAMAERGVRMGAAGLVNGRVTKVMTTVQTLAVEVANRSLDALLAELQEVRDAQLSALLDEVRRLPDAPPPGIRDMIGSSSTNARAGYVSRDTVMTMIAAMMGTPAR